MSSSGRVLEVFGTQIYNSPSTMRGQSIQKCHLFVEFFIKTRLSHGRFFPKKKSD